MQTELTTARTECSELGQAIGEGLAVFRVAADEDRDAHRVCHGGLGGDGPVGRLGVVGVHDLDVVGAVAGHHLVAADAERHRVHDRPLRCCAFEAAPGLGLGQRDRRTPPDVHVQPIVLDEDPRPDDLAGPGHAADRAPAEPEIHRRLAHARG